MYCTIQHNAVLIGTYRKMQNNLLECTVRTMCNYTAIVQLRKGVFQNRISHHLIEWKSGIKAKNTLYNVHHWLRTDLAKTTQGDTEDDIKMPLHISCWRPFWFSSLSLTYFFIVFN